VVAEYGVGFGWNLAELRCRRKIGFDVAGFLAEEVRHRGMEFVEDIGSLPAKTADVVICCHTLEHVQEPAKALNDILRLLKRNGLLLLSTPWERERRYRRFDRNEPNHHLFTWNAQTLGNLVEACGLRVRYAETAVYGYDRFAAVWASRLNLGEPGFRGLRRALQLLRPLREARVVAAREFAD
jgi:SAM-dependent methyltransferase